MNDFDYDVYQKKRIASGDRHRKRGSKSKYCGLPSDHMTRAQWKKKNGEVKAMNLNEPMSWDAFKAMPDDLQKEYISKLVSRFHCRQTDLSELFGVDPNTVWRHFKLMELGHLFPKGKRPRQEDLSAFRQWVSQGASSASSPMIETTLADAPKKKTVSALGIADTFEAEWHGDVDLIEVMQLVYQFANGDPIQLHITASREASHKPI